MELIGFDVDERITELDIYDPERDEPYIRCDYCDQMDEHANMAIVDSDGAVCQSCAAEENRNACNVPRYDYGMRY